MIYELMKRDPTWRAAPWVTAVFAILWPVFLTRTSHELVVVIFGGFFSVFLVLAVVFASGQDLSTNFLSALPVTAPQVFLARVLAMVALLWMPVLVGSAIQIVLPRPDLPAPLPALGAYATLLALGLQSALLTGVSLPRWLMLGMFTVCFAFPMPVAAMVPFRMSRYAIPFAAVSLTAGAALFMRT